MRLRKIVFLIVFSLLAFVPVDGQSPNGTISGIVADPSGATVPGADILIANDATGVQYPAKTNSEGLYVVPNLPPGSYRLQVSKIGFKTIIKPDIVIHVQDALAINFTLPIGAASEIVTVQGGAPLINTQDGAVGTVIDRTFVENLPLNGRSFNTLLQLTPGVTFVPANIAEPGQFSVNGQRQNANYVMVDGVSANFGSGISFTPGSASGATPAFNALGGTSSLVSVDAVQEFRVETSSFAPEYGRTPGGQISIETRSGTNAFHGDMFDYFRNDVLDANDWFANAQGKPRAAERQNDFGGVFGGAIVRDKTFFFVSYEGLRLRQPQTTVISVPSVPTRRGAVGSAVAYLNAFPLPDCASCNSTAGTASFTGNWSNSASLDAGSMRIDHTFGEKLKVFGRYNESPSHTLSRTDGLSELQDLITNTRTITAGANAVLTPHLGDSFRFNYSTQRAGYSNSLDSFGGAVPLSDDFLVPSPFSAKSSQGVFIPSNGVPSLSIGPNSDNHVRQIAFADDANWSLGRHLFKFGADYRRIIVSVPSAKLLSGYELFGTLQQFGASSTADLVIAALSRPGKALFQNVSLFGQDSWKIGTRLTLTYGLRWELNPAPVGVDGTVLGSWLNVNDPSKIVLAPAGTPVWQTTSGNFAPRVGLAYKVDDKGQLVIRGGWGLFYDLGVGDAASTLLLFPNLVSTLVFGQPLPVTNAASITPTFSTQPPYQVGFGTEGFSPNLQLPYSLQWNLAAEKSLGNQQSITLTYVGQAGRRLLRMEDEAVPNANFGGFAGGFTLTANSGTSDYNALQVQYKRSLTRGLQVLANYTWSHSIDNDSNDFFNVVSRQVLSAQDDRGRSDFDIRHNFVGAFTYRLPGFEKKGIWASVANGWGLDGVIQARTGAPINVVTTAVSVPGVSLQTATRPDLVPGVPVWLSDSVAPGGKRLNRAAFDVAAPAAAKRQGDLGRNSISGFGMTQVDLSLSRNFRITEMWKLQLRTDAFNVLNHANFANPVSSLDAGALFGLSNRMLNNGLSGFGGGLNALYQLGGPRSLQLSLKLQF